MMTSPESQVSQIEGGEAVAVSSGTFLWHKHLPNQQKSTVIHLTDRLDETMQNCGMQAPPSSRIVAAERMKDGVFIEFDDGKCALFSSSLLRDTLPKAEEVRFEDEDENKR